MTTGGYHFFTLFSWQWRNKVAVGPRASIPKGPPLPKKKLLLNSVGQILGPHSAGPACTARLARPIVTPPFLGGQQIKFYAF